MAASDGAYGMRSVISGNTPSYAQDASPSNESAYSASFAFNLDGTDTRGATTDAFTALAGGTSPATVPSLRYRRVTGPVRLQLRLSAARSGGTATTAWCTVTSAFHTVAVTWSSARSATVSLAGDGVTRESPTRLDTSARHIETVRLGPSGSAGGGGRAP